MRDGYMAQLQNPNEWLNPCYQPVSAWCPKHKHHSVHTVHCTVASAFCHFRSGAGSREMIMEGLSITAGHHTRHNSFVRDKKRLRKSDFHANQKQTKRCEWHAFLPIQREEALHEAEGVSLKQQGFKQPPVSFNAWINDLHSPNIYYWTF
jgi:hypothetical protein